MLKRLFTSTTRVKILRLLMFNPDRWYHLREIAREIKATPAYVKKEIDNLREINLINKKRKGNLTLFNINKKSLILTELRELFLKSDYLLFKQMCEKTKLPESDTLLELSTMLSATELQRFKKIKEGLNEKHQ